MVDYNASRPGLVNGAGTADALFLQVFAGEVLASFSEKQFAMDKQLVRTISQGKAASFPVFGRTSAAYHTPGQEILGNTILHNEKVITINDLLLSSVFIGNIDEAKNHYEVRAAYAAELGGALARQMDRHILQTMVQAALTTTPSVSGETDRVGSTIVNLDVHATLSMATDADTLINAIFLASEYLDNKFVPPDDRTVFLKPKQYNLLANNSKALNVDYGNAGNGNIAEGRIMRVAGMQIVKATDIPTTNITGTGVTAGGAAGRQAVNASNTVAIITHKSAVGTLKLMDLATEMTYQVERQGTLMVAKYAVGHGVLRPEAAVLLKTA